MAMYRLDGRAGELYNANKQAKSNAQIERDRKRKVKQEQNKKSKEDYAQKQIHTQRWQHTRKEVIIADGGECQRCLRLLGMHVIDNLQVHHIKSRNQFPELMYDLDNMITLCGTCNRTLGENGIDFIWTPDMRFRKVNDEIHL